LTSEKLPKKTKKSFFLDRVKRFKDYDCFHWSTMNKDDIEKQKIPIYLIVLVLIIGAFFNIP